MVTADDVLKSVTLRDAVQQTRIRDLFTRADAGYQNGGVAGIKNVLEADCNRLKARFDEAIKKVKKDAGT